MAGHGGSRSHVWRPRTQSSRRQGKDRVDTPHPAGLPGCLWRRCISSPCLPLQVTADMQVWVLDAPGRQPLPLMRPLFGPSSPQSSCSEATGGAGSANPTLSLQSDRLLQLWAGASHPCPLGPGIISAPVPKRPLLLAGRDNGYALAGAARPPWAALLRPPLMPSQDLRLLTCQLCQISPSQKGPEIGYLVHDGA